MSQQKETKDILHNAPASALSAPRSRPMPLLTPGQEKFITYAKSELGLSL